MFLDILNKATKFKAISFTEKQKKCSNQNVPDRRLTINDNKSNVNVIAVLLLHTLMSYTFHMIVVLVLNKLNNTNMGQIACAKQYQISTYIA